MRLITFSNPRNERNRKINIGMAIRPGYGYNSSDMFLRAFVTSGLISAIYILVIFNLIPRQLFDDGFYFIIGIFWSLGFFTVTAFVYGRKIKRNFRGETGTIKWFDPSKGYGF